MDRLRQWLSDDVVESELSPLGRKVLELIRGDRVRQFPRMITNNVSSSNSVSDPPTGLSSQSLNAGISKEMGLCARNDISMKELLINQNNRMSVSSADEESAEEDDPVQEVDDLLQTYEKNDDTAIHKSVRSNESLNERGELFTQFSELNNHADRTFNCCAEELVLSGVVSPEELQDVNNIIAESDIFFSDMEELTNSLELDGKSIEQKNDHCSSEVLRHTETNCLSSQLTTNQPLSTSIGKLENGSVPFVCDISSDYKIITNTSNLSDNARNNEKDLISEAEKVSFTEETNLVDPSPGSSFCFSTELLEDSSDKEATHSETCEGNDDGIVQNIISAENGIKLPKTQDLRVKNNSEGLNVCENKSRVDSLTEFYQESRPVVEDPVSKKTQHRPVQHFSHNDYTFHTKRSSVKTKKFKVPLKQLNIKDMFQKKAEEDGFEMPLSTTESYKKIRTFLSETNQNPVLSKRNSSMSDAKLKSGGSVKNKSTCSKNDTLKKMEHVEKHKKSFKVSQGRKSFPFPEVKLITERKKEIIGSESVFLDDITASELEERLCRAEPLEIGMTLVYRGGYCDLNKPAVSTVLSVHKSVGALLSIKVSETEVPNFYYISFDENDWKDIASPKRLLKTVLNHTCRKMCFCAQDFMMEITKRFQFSRNEVCLKWILLDPLIGCWLLNPDKSFYFFSDITEALGLKEKDEPNQTKLSSLPQALERLSLCVMLLYKKLDKAGLWRLFLEIETKLVSILSVMETRGICTNTRKLREMQHILHEHLNNLQQQAYKEAGKQFQMNSPQQLRNILYEELQLDQKSNTKVKETAKRGQKSTSEHMLSLLKSCHPLPGTVLQYRHLQKIKSTFVDGVLQQVVEGKVYPSWGQQCTATGRITSSNPNVQAVPKQPVVLNILPDEDHSSTKILNLRSPYHTKDGYSLVSADFQHIELRMLAHLSRDPLLIEILQKSDDVFTSMSRIWLGKTQDTIEAEDREKTKRIVYAVMYGAGPAKLSEFLNINNTEASNIINSFLAHFPAIKKFSNVVVKECQAKKCLHTITGRHRLFPHISSGNSGLKSYTERQAVNFLMQGSAADICKCAMIRTELEFLKHPELDVHLIIQIHDELVWEVKDEHFDIVKDIIRKSMEDCSNIYEFQIQISVPLPVIIKKGKDWANMQEI